MIVYVSHPIHDLTVQQNQIKLKKNVHIIFKTMAFVNINPNLKDLPKSVMNDHSQPTTNLFPVSLPHPVNKKYEPDQKTIHPSYVM